VFCAYSVFDIIGIRTNSDFKEDDVRQRVFLVRLTGDYRRGSLGLSMQMHTVKWLGCVVGVLVILVTHGYARAAAWSVEKDGSGDFVAIQDAVDASASGDTILIGAGRFTETVLYPVPSGEFTPHNYVVIDEKSLTLIGAGSEYTIIGPEEPWYTTDQDPFGISVWSDTASVMIRDVTVENVARGLIVSHNNIRVYDSCFMGCELGGIIWVYGGGAVSGCEFVDNGTGLLVMTSDRRLEVSNLLLHNNQMALSVQYSDSVYVGNCEISNSRVGVYYTVGSSGEVRSCRLENIDWYGIIAAQAASLAVYDCSVEGGDYYQLDCVGCQDLIVEDSIFRGGGIATVRIANGHVAMHHNHIMKNGGYSVQVMDYQSPPSRMLDFTDNYWGTAESDSISSWIWDGNDNPNIHAIVDYEPFSPIPLPSEKKSMGDIKRMFR
jgi:hypothetical protein